MAWRISAIFALAACLAGAGSACALKIRTPFGAAGLSGFASATSAGPASALVFAVQPPTVASGSQMTGGPFVEIRDAAGARVASGADSSLPVTLALVSGDGFVVGTTTVTASAGIADFSSAGLMFSLGGNKTLQAQATGSLGSLTQNSASFAVSVPAPTQVARLAGVARTAGISPGTGTSARIHTPWAIASDGTYYYIPDNGANVILRMNIATRAVDVLAGTAYQAGEVDGVGPIARFDGPVGAAYGGGFLYVSDINSNVIRKIDVSTAQVTSLAGTPYSCAFANGVFNTGKFCNVEGLTLLGGVLYVADNSNCRVRTVDPTTGNAGVLAGTSTCSIANGAFGSTHFSSPMAITTDGTDLYVADSDRLRKLTMGTTTSSTVFGPAAGAIDSILYSSNRLYYTVAASVLYYDLVGASNNLLSGQTWTQGFLDGASPLFYRIFGMVVEGSNILVSDSGNALIRSVDTTSGAATTIVGQVPSGGVGYAEGAASSVRMNAAGQPVSDGTYVYYPDYNNNLIRRLDRATGASTLYAGTVGSWGSTNGARLSSTFNNPTALAIDGKSLFVSDQSSCMIRQINLASGTVSTLAGSGTCGTLDGTGTGAQVYNPWGIATDGTYVYFTGNDIVRKVEISTGIVSKVSGTVGANACASGDVNTSQYAFAGAGYLTYLGGYLYLVDYWCGDIRKIDPATGISAPLAGTYNVHGYLNATGAAAQFSSPNSGGMGGITTDGYYLYVADRGNAVVRKIDPSSGQVTTVYGVPNENEENDGSVATATFGMITFDNLSSVLNFMFGRWYVPTDRNIRQIY